MAEKLSATDAAALLEPEDRLGVPLGTGQPVALMAALGERTDWQHLSIYGALITAWSEAYKHPNVHYLSGFFGPVERALRDQGANISFAPADFRRFEPMLIVQAPRVMATAVAPPDSEGNCSLSLHAGASVAELHRAGADPDRLLIAEASPAFPRTVGLPPEHDHCLRLDEIDVLVESDASPLPLPAAEPTDADRAIAEHCAAFIEEGATLQTGIGAVPSFIVSLLADGPGGDYGIHSEMFTDGLMRLHQAGKVTNRKGQFDGVSVTTFAAGSADLYEWLDGNEEVVFLPVDVVNTPSTIAANPKLITVNAALATDIHGQVVADSINGRQYSGIGGHEDFTAAAGRSLDARALLCLPSTATNRRQDDLADRPLARGGDDHHYAAPSGRRDRHRVRRGRARGQDGAPAGAGAGQGRPPGLPRRAGRGGRARLEGRITPRLNKRPG